MPAVNLHLNEAQLVQTDHLAQRLNKTRTAYIREAIEAYNTQTQRDLLADQFATASRKCRQANLEICQELEAADHLLDDA